MNALLQFSAQRINPINALTLSARAAYVITSSFCGSNTSSTSNTPNCNCRQCGRSWRKKRAQSDFSVFSMRTSISWTFVTRCAGVVAIVQCARVSLPNYSFIAPSTKRQELKCAQKQECSTRNGRSLKCASVLRAS